MMFFFIKNVKLSSLYQKLVLYLKRHNPILSYFLSTITFPVLFYQKTSGKAIYLLFQSLMNIEILVVQTIIGLIMK